MTTDDLKNKLQSVMKGGVSDDKGARRRASRDTSLFMRMPELVVYPVDANDVSEIVRVVGAERSRGTEVSVTARAGGTDMSGGPLTTSIVV
ncbi:MAG: FAD-binding oxidoreductase, partial [Patescibacteria group bacterium]